jgi:hypothetical protein
MDAARKYRIGYPLHNPSTGCTVRGMARARAITHLELIPVVVSGQEGWVEAKWERADGSEGGVVAHLRLRTAELWYIAMLMIVGPTTALLRDVPLARIENAVNADPELHPWLERSLPPDVVERRTRDRAERPRLRRPKDRRLDDDFYRQVAEAYRAAVNHGLPPAKTLAEDSDTPQGTVNRWIAKAREVEGGLKETTPGKVSA